ncbi:galactosyltransferase-related protein [Streptomyces sp.]|uniref:galactosyltransferase-related protein n=1 Tax=Streptomyces sp. TaxID=1931 RepID=UPI002F93963D
MPSLDVAVVIPWRGGDPDRERHHEVVRARLRDVFPDAWHIDADSGHHPFNRAGSRNRGVRMAQDVGAGVVVVNDADTIPEPGPLRAAVQQAAADGCLHTPYTRFVGLTEAGTRDYLAGLPLQRCGVDLEYGFSVGGVFVIRPDAWWRAGGMNKRFTAWGSEDMAFRRAADTLLGPTVRHDGTIVHLWHPPASRSGAAVNAGWDLAARYTAAAGDRVAMAALVAEEVRCQSR